LPILPNEDFLTSIEVSQRKVWGRSPRRMKESSSLFWV
jgi:hypothetical protein